MILVANQGHFADCRQIECAEEAAETATNNQDFRVLLSHKFIFLNGMPEASRCYQTKPKMGTASLRAPATALDTNPICVLVSNS